MDAAAQRNEEEAAEKKKYLLDGEPLNVEEFMVDHRDFGSRFDALQRAAVRTLKVGMKLYFGQDQGPLYVLARVA